MKDDVGGQGFASAVDSTMAERFDYDLQRSESPVVNRNER